MILTVAIHVGHLVLARQRNILKQMELVGVIHSKIDSGKRIMSLLLDCSTNCATCQGQSDFCTSCSDSNILSVKNYECTLSTHELSITAIIRPIHASLHLFSESSL